MALAFSSGGDNVITRQVITACTQPSFTNIADEFDISSTAAWISAHNFTRVCTTLTHVTQHGQQHKLMHIQYLLSHSVVLEN